MTFKTFLLALIATFVFTACSGTGGRTDETPPSGSDQNGGTPESTPEPEPTDCSYSNITIGTSGTTRIEAENYNLCDSSYGDSDAVNTGGEYREDGVDIYSDVGASNGHFVADIADGEYLEFSVNVVRSGFYSITYRVDPSAENATALALSSDGEVLEDATMTAGASGLGWTDYASSGVYLSDGAHVLKLAFVAGGAALDYIELVFSEDLILEPQATVNAMRVGINMGNTFDAPNEGDWAPAAQRRYFEDFASAGFLHVRIPVTWQEHTAQTAPYAIEDDFIDRVEQVVDWALEENGYVIINAHHEAWLKEDADNPVLQARFDSIWRQVAERFQNKSSRLMFEILNEPNGMTQSQSNATHSRILPIIREFNPNRLVIFTGNDYSSADRLLEAQIPDDEHVIGNFHSYDPWPFAGQCTRDWGSDEDVAALEAIYDSVKAWSQSNDVAVMVNEFGSAKYDFNKPENVCVQADRLRYLRTHAELAIEHGFAGTVWDDGGSFSFYSRADGSWGEEKDVLVNASP